MKMIDAGDGRPPEVDPDVWKALEAKRKTREAQEKSAKMSSISRGKCTKEAQMRAIEKTMIGELVKTTCFRSCLLVSFLDAMTYLAKTAGTSMLHVIYNTVVDNPHVLVDT
jgi:hypothetical protein